jgi:hypothetical protein
MRLSNLRVRIGVAVLIMGIPVALAARSGWIVADPEFVVASQAVDRAEPPAQLDLATYDPTGQPIQPAVACNRLICNTDRDCVQVCGVGAVCGVIRARGCFVP